jgi:lipopolysaccharide export LptBFGC system permease protein LptF
MGASNAVHLSAGMDRALTALVVVSVAVAFVFGFRRHRDLRVALGVGLGLVVYLWGHALEGTGYGTPVSVLGGMLLAAASFVGARLGHSCEHAH